MLIFVIRLLGQSSLNTASSFCFLCNILYLEKTELAMILVGIMTYKNVGKPTFLFCIYRCIVTLPFGKRYIGSFQT